MDITKLMLFALSVLCLINLVLVLRLVARNRATDTFTEHNDKLGGAPLAIGSVAPPFNVLTSTGQSIGDERLAGRSVLYLFVSPNCDHCRDVMPAAEHLSPIAQQAAGVQFVVVTDLGPLRTRAWLEQLDAEDGVTVTLPVLTAPSGRSTMMVDYNPPGVLPYFCLVSKLGRVVARGYIGGPDWTRQVEQWHTTRAERAATEQPAPEPAGASDASRT